jgi:hypothetical protein
MNTVEELPLQESQSAPTIIASVEVCAPATAYNPTLLIKLINQRITAMENELGALNRRLIELEKSAHQNSNSTNVNC